MAGKFMKSSMKGALMGFGLTGGWLLADLLLPEPWGDVALFSAMAVVNIGVGWKLGKFYDEQSSKETVASLEAGNSAKFEAQS